MVLIIGVTGMNNQLTLKYWSWIGAFTVFLLVLVSACLDACSLIPLRLAPRRAFCFLPRRLLTFSDLGCYQIVTTCLCYL